MAYFASSRDVYATLGRMLDEMCVSRGLGATLAGAGADVQFALSSPSARITLRLSGGRPRARFGGSALTAGLTVEATADTAHDLFLGRRTMAGAMADGDVRLRGPVAELVPLWATIAFAAPAYYEAMLQRDGRSELVAS